MRAIDADALKSALWESWGYNSLVAEICEFVDEQPTIQSDEPRVMTLEEAKKAEVCWLEQCGYEPFATLEASTWNPERYGKSYRCWNHMPTEEQRKAVKWDATD